MSDILALASAINAHASAVSALAAAIAGNNELAAAAQAGGTAPQADAKPDKPKEPKPKADKKPAEDKKPDADLAATASAAVVALHKAKGRDVVIAMLDKFGAKGAKDLKTDEDRATVIDLAEKLMAVADGDEDAIAEILGGEDEFG